jgi:Flp pilus assembly protein TadD
MASRHDRKFAFSYVERGKQLAAAKQYPEALEALREAVRRDPTLVEAWIMLASVHLERYEDAEAQLANAQQAAADHSSFWAVKGSLHTHRGQYDEALAAIKKAIELDEGDEQSAFAWECMGELLIALEDYEKALDVAEHGLELRPHDWRLQELKAAALRGLGRDAEADEIEHVVQTRLAEQLALLDQNESV